MKKHYLKTMLIALGLLAATPGAQAASQKDMQILGRALGFIENGPSGDVKIGIVTDSGNAASSAEADEIVGLIGGGLASGKINLVGEKEPSLQFKQAENVNENQNNIEKKYSKNVIKPSQIEINYHAEFLKKEIKKNYF